MKLLLKKIKKQFVSPLLFHITIKFEVLGGNFVKVKLCQDTTKAGKRN